MSQFALVDYEFDNISDYVTASNMLDQSVIIQMKITTSCM